MLFSSIGREGIGLKDTLARAGRRGKSKKFMEAIRGLILQEGGSRNADLTWAVENHFPAGPLT